MESGIFKSFMFYDYTSAKNISKQMISRCFAIAKTIKMALAFKTQLIIEDKVKKKKFHP